jgi:ribosomal protein S18 acetylase RimI-like enzyme
MKLMPIVYVSRMEPAVRFYRRLGFTVEAESRAGEWVELGADLYT